MSIIKRNSIFIASVCICLFFSGCRTEKNAIKSGKWNIESIYGKPIGPDNQNELYIEFDTEKGLIGGYDGCNSFGGSFIISKRGEIGVKDIITTARYCPETEGEQLGKILNVIKGYKIKRANGKLYLILTDKDGKACLELYESTTNE